MLANKIEYIDSSSFKPPYMKNMEPVAHIVNYRGLPEPWVEISLDEFLMVSSTWCPTHYTWHQLLIPGEKHVRNGWALWNHLYGYGAFKGSAEYGLDKFKRETYLHSTTARFFKFGCEHKNAEHRSTRNCQHDYKCLDCGVRWGYDSGD